MTAEASRTRISEHAAVMCRSVDPDGPALIRRETRNFLECFSVDGGSATWTVYGEHAASSFLQRYPHVEPLLPWFRMALLSLPLLFSSPSNLDEEQMTIITNIVSLPLPNKKGSNIKFRDTESHDKETVSQ